MNYYNEIKEQLINNEVYKKVKDYSKNRSDLETYYNVGKLLVEAQGGEERSEYGNSLIKEYSKKLTNELGRGYSSTNLKYMRKFYLLKKGQSLIDQFNVSWTHYIFLLSLNDVNEINYYLNIVKEQNLSVRELRERIKSKEYQRLDKNTKEKLIKKLETKITDLTKNPIIIRNTGNYEKISEKVLKQLILEDIEHFMKELGDDYDNYKDDDFEINL